MFRLIAWVMLIFPVWVQAAGEAPLQVQGAMTVNVFQAKRLFDMGAVFVDVRPEHRWGWGHVDGAVNLALHGSFQSLAMPHWPRQVPLVIYCDSDVCPAGAAAAAKAVEWGYQQVFYFREGYFAWQLADFPQGKGEASGFFGTLTAGR